MGAARWRRPLRTAFPHFAQRACDVIGGVVCQILPRSVLALGSARVGVAQGILGAVQGGVCFQRKGREGVAQGTAR